MPSTSKFRRTPASSIRSASEVEEFYKNCLADPAFAVNNSHLSFLLAEVGEAFKSLTGFSLPGQPTVYARFLQDASRLVVHTLLETIPELKDNLSAIAIRGPVAFGIASPFRTFIEGKKLPEQTFSLFQAIYQWLFSSLGKSDENSNVRFLDPVLTTQLELICIQSRGRPVEAEMLQEAIGKELIAGFNFSPPVVVNIMDISAFTLEQALSVFYIYSTQEMIGSLTKQFDRLGKDECHQITTSAIDHIVRFLTSAECLSDLECDPAGRSAAIMDGYLKLRSGASPMVILDPLTDQVKMRSEWHCKNEHFFRTLIENDFESLIVEDATHQLGDEKGYEKDNQFTLCKVVGLKRGEELIPAERVMLKVRGLSYYRGALNHILDTIKEYMSYAYLFSHVAEPSQYLLNVGPLIFTLEKLTVPYSTGETRRWIGFFIEELPSPDEGRLFTSRVVKVTDFWSQEACLRKVFKSANQHGVRLDRKQLSAHLKKLARWSWQSGMSIDYCDAVLYLDTHGNICGVKIIDFERLSFGELVNEKHIVLDTLVDVKSYLRPKYWDDVLHRVYLSEKALAEPLALTEVQKYLRKRSLKWVMMLRVLHSLEKASHWFGPSLGNAIWGSVLSFLVKIT